MNKFVKFEEEHELQCRRKVNPFTADISFVSKF